MKIKNLLILGLVLLGFTYCSSDEVLDGPTTGNENASNLKMEIAIKMPTGAATRSSTGADGTTGVTNEAGSAEENKVNSVLIALFNSEGEHLASHTSELANAAATGDKFYTTAEFKIPDGLKVDDQFYVYAFVNPYEGLDGKLLDSKFTAKKTFETTIDAITKRGEAGSETQDNFFMSNAETAQLTPKITANNISGAPLQVGVSVQRAVARFDYVAKTLVVDNEYSVTGSTDVTVKFTDYKLINTSKSFYNLKRVNNSPTTPEEITIGGTETATNYVVDTDWTVKMEGATTNWAGGFFNYMGTVSTPSDFIALDTRSYVTENTMPENNRSKKGIATAVVFKGQIVVPAKYTNETPGHQYKSTATSPVYVWNNKFYGTFDKLPQAIQDIVTFDELIDDELIDHAAQNAKITAAAAALASAGVTGYSHEAAYGYPVYYVYYNRHNDNRDASLTGPMEFATVRNNIYKLTINSLSKFGHPNDPEIKDPTNPDPNPEKPEDPIESADLYMQVTATVLDWTVRQNNIEF